MDLLDTSSLPGETFEDTLRPMLDMYKTQLTIPSYRFLQNLLEFFLFIEGGSMTELGSQGYSLVPVPIPTGIDTDVKGGYGNLFKKIAKEDGVTDVVKFNKIVKRVT